MSQARKPGLLIPILLGIVAVLGLLPVSLVMLNSHLQRDIVVTEGTSYGLEIGMTKEEVHRALLQRYGGPIISTIDPSTIHSLTPDSRVFSYEMQKSNHWRCYPGGKKFVRRHALFFEENRLIRIVTQRALLEENRSYAGPDGEIYTR